MVIVAPCAAIFDALENLISFVMLADPMDFANWLVYPYSSLVVIKFLIYTVTYVWAVLGIAIASTTAGVRAARSYSLTRT